MARMKIEVQKLADEGARLEQEINQLETQLAGKRGELAGIKRAVALVTGQEAEVTSAPPPRKERARNVKETVLSALEGAGPTGLTVNQLLERTERDGAHLERGTVSSLLSRFKREGLLMLEDGRYFIAPKTAPVVTGWGQMN